LDLGLGAHGGGDHGGGLEADVDAEGVEDDEDVGEEDRRVDAEEVDGWSVTSAHRSGERHSSVNETRLRMARYSGM
jgi:hypothetical protein